MNACLDSSTFPAAPPAKVSGKYLTFFLGRETYGLPVLQVREIIRMLPITPVPQMPAYVKGVINLRGKVVPVIDLRAKFDLPETGLTDSTCMIVVQIAPAGAETRQIGLIVDAVEEVANIAQCDIEAPPDFGGSLAVHYLLGMAKVKGVVKALLNIDQVIAAETIERIGMAAQEEQS